MVQNKVAPSFYLRQQQPEQKPSIRERIIAYGRQVNKAKATLATGVTLIVCGVGWAAYQIYKAAYNARMTEALTEAWNESQAE